MKEWESPKSRKKFKEDKEGVLNVSTSLVDLANMKLLGQSQINTPSQISIKPYTSESKKLLVQDQSLKQFESIASYTLPGMPMTGEKRN